jgi:hypothetical protein
VDSEAFALWVRSLVQERRLTNDEADDILEQRRLFDEQRSIIEAEFDGSVIGLVSGQRIARRTMTELLDLAAVDFRGRQVYFEPMGRASWLVR